MVGPGDLPSDSAVNGLDCPTSLKSRSKPKGLLGGLSNRTGPPPESRSPAGLPSREAPEIDRLGGTIEEENTPSATRPQENIDICRNCEETLQLPKRTAQRQRLPNRRESENFSFELNGLRLTATVSIFDDGRIAELFLNTQKPGTAVDINARDAAIILSIALQLGADTDAIRWALCRDSQGRALGPIGRALDLIIQQRRAHVGDVPPAPAEHSRDTQ
jgi:ribonucleoside-diphosphate reductase alpha chain